MFVRTRVTSRKGGGEGLTADLEAAQNAVAANERGVDDKLDDGADDAV